MMMQPMRKTLLKIIFLAVLAVPMAATTAWAEKIRQIQVEGNERVETSTVKSYLGLEEGGEYSPVRAREALKSLYGTGLFDNVEIGWDDGRLLVDVRENPIVNQIAYEGNDALSDERLQAVVTLRPRAVFTPGKVQEDVKAMLAAYRQSGRYLAQINPQIIRRDQNRVDVIFVVDEGAKTKIRKINFVGNKKFPDPDLKRVVATREAAFWRFLTSADSYDPDRIEFDKELLRRFYLKNGYADFRVISAVAELSKTKEDFFVTYTLDEGKVYNFGTVDVTLSSRENIDLAELRQVVTLKEGDRYDASRIDTNIDSLIDLLGQKGFAFLDVIPVFDKNTTDRTINVTFDVRPGPRVYISRINIQGNTRTRDNVIRREMRLAEGDAFSNTRLQRSRDRLQVVDYFETVELTQNETEDPDRIEIGINVKEKSTGEFNIGAGFSTFEGVIGTTELRERNFLGKGQQINLAFAVSGERQDVNFSFTEPWFLGKELAAGIDLLNEKREFQDESSFDQKTIGGGLRLGFPLSEFVRNSIRFAYRETEISDVGAAASNFVKAEAGTRDSLVLSNTVAYDTRDSTVLPTRGSRLAWTAEYSGFGTNTEYIRNTVSASRHFPVAEGWVLSGNVRGGYLYDFNDDTPLFENYNLGGFDLRGFDRAGIGPRDTNTGDALGGRLMAGHNIELRFPIPGVKDNGVNGVLFTDGGIVTDFRTNDALIADSKKYRISAGIGMFWNSPLGPLRFEWGFPIVEADEDDTRVFAFNFGSRF